MVEIFNSRVNVFLFTIGLSINTSMTSTTQMGGPYPGTPAALNINYGSSPSMSHLELNSSLNPSPSGNKQSARSKKYALLCLGIVKVSILFQSVILGKRRRLLILHHCKQRLFHSLWTGFMIQMSHGIAFVTRYFNILSTSLVLLDDGVAFDRNFLSSTK